MSVADGSCPIHAGLATQSILAGEELPPEFASCLGCAQDLRAVRDLRALGGALEWTPPEAARAAAVRGRVVGVVAPTPVAVPRRPGRLKPALASMAPVFAALIVVLALGHRVKRAPVGAASPPAALGVVREVGPARFERTQSAPDEVVRLDEGRIHVAVTHLAPAERFRIVTGDAVVEVRGTEFEVQAAAAQLQAVAVERGRVEVRVGTNGPAMLTAGDHWSVAIRAVTPPPAPTSVAEPAPTPARIAHTSRARPERVEGVPPREQPTTTERPAGPVAAPPAFPAAELSPGRAFAPPQQTKIPVAPQRPAAAVSPPGPEAKPSESERRERDEDRADRRERREERRLDRLEHRR